MATYTTLTPEDIRFTSRVANNHGDWNVARDCRSDRRPGSLVGHPVVPEHLRDSRYFYRLD